MYRIDYEDGDREDMVWNELSRLLVGITVSSTGTPLVAGDSPPATSTHRSVGNLDGNSDGGSADSRHTGRVICAHVFDWTGSRPTLYRFAGSSPMSEIAKTYAAERGLDWESLTCHMYDTHRKGPIETSLNCTLEDTARKHSRLNSEGETFTDECRVFVRLKHFPDYIEGGSTRFIGPRDFLRLQRRRRRRARMASNA